MSIIKYRLQNTDHPPILPTQYVYIVETHLEITTSSADVWKYESFVNYNHI